MIFSRCSNFDIGIEFSEEGRKQWRQIQQIHGIQRLSGDVKAISDQRRRVPTCKGLTGLFGTSWSLPNPHRNPTLGFPLWARACMGLWWELHGLFMTCVAGHSPWIWGVPEMGEPQNRWFRRKNTSETWMIWGYPHFRTPPYTRSDPKYGGTSGWWASHPGQLAESRGVPSALA